MKIPIATIPFSQNRQSNFSNFVKNTATCLNIPGAAVGIWANGEEFYSCYGVTSIANPLPVTQQTLFILGSITKTYTATAIQCLIAKGEIIPDMPVRHYLPEFQLSDDDAAAKITVAQLLNHTSGLDWGVTIDTGEGDDALEKYVAFLSRLKLLDQSGKRFSYSQAGYNILGRIIEKITAQPYEKAIADLLLTPLGLKNSFFYRDKIMTRRFCVGHNKAEDGTLSVADLWRRWRGENPGGGLASSVEDQIRWARFHLADKTFLKEEKPVLPESLIRKMQEPTVSLRASNLGDAVGTGWFLRKVDGVQTVGHAGSANGQFGELLFIPELNFAIATLANAGPAGILFNREIVKWVLLNYTGIDDKDPEQKGFDPKIALELTGHYENEVMTLDVFVERNKLKLEVLMKKEIRLASDKELPPDHDPFYFGMLPEKPDEYMITSGAFKGQRGYFTRDDSNKVTGIDLAGRLFSRK